jgi:hypothetical protein
VCSSDLRNWSALILVNVRGFSTRMEWEREQVSSG